MEYITINLNEQETRTLQKMKKSLDTIINDKYYKGLYNEMIGNIPFIIRNAIYNEKLPYDYVLNTLQYNNEFKVNYMKDNRRIENMIFNFIIYKMPEYIIYHYLKYKGYDVFFDSAEGDMLNNVGSYSINNNCDLSLKDNNITYKIELQYSYLYKTEELRKNPKLYIKANKLDNIYFNSDENTYFLFLIYDFKDRRFKVLPINMIKDYDKFNYIGYCKEFDKKYYELSYNIDDLINL